MNIKIFLLCCGLMLGFSAGRPLLGMESAATFGPAERTAVLSCFFSLVEHVNNQEQRQRLLLNIRHVFGVQGFLVVNAPGGAAVTTTD